jgi:anaerobic selenocysteine-containing dehydrogenase
VQGIGSVGVTPKLKDAIFTRLKSHFGVELPTTPGRDTMACIEGAAAGELKVGFCLGGNLYGSNPDASFAASAIGNLDQITYLSTTLNSGHAHGLARETIILPVLARDEEPQPTTQESMFNFIRLSDGGPRRHDGPRSEIDVIASIAERILRSEPAVTVATLASASAPGSAGGSSNKLVTSHESTNGDTANPRQSRGLSALDWSKLRSTAEIRTAIASIVPGFEKMADIDRTREEFHIDDRRLHEPNFSTSDGWARLHTHELPELAGTADDELRLMTIRSEGQFNTVVYEDEDIYRGIDRRDVILLHTDDLSRLKLNDGDSVTIHGPAGSMPGIRATAFPTIKPGNAAMYYPECNILVSRALDPQSKTPAFKGVVIRVER